MNSGLYTANQSNMHWCLTTSVQQYMPGMTTNFLHEMPNNKSIVSNAQQKYPAYMPGNESNAWQNDVCIARNVWQQMTSDKCMATNAKKTHECLSCIHFIRETRRDPHDNLIKEKVSFALGIIEWQQNHGNECPPTDSRQWAPGKKDTITEAHC